MTYVIKRELADILEVSEIVSLYSRLNAMKKIEGNPMGVEIQGR
ncbi:hypothetical protein [Radiobacillus kanasensis]|nr:hypothetical protein [Radiobacillus kanasensis]